MTDDPKKKWHTAVDLGDIELRQNEVGDLEFVASDACYSGTVDLQKAKLLTRVLLNYISEREGAVFVIEAKDKPAGTTPSDIDHTKLIPKEEARKKFALNSRSQEIITEIYRGGTQAEVVQRMWGLKMFRSEIIFLPGYLEEVLSKIQKGES